MGQLRVRRALISVYDKTGIVEFARTLHAEFGIEIISTGGTAKTLREAGVPVTLIEDITGFPEMLDGRVKTLHPNIHAAILADRDNPQHMRQLEAAGIKPIDMVVVNLYPFEKTIADPSCTLDQAIEMIDIGGVALLRAAAKNAKHVICITEPQNYPLVRGFIDMCADSPAQNAAAVFRTTSQYDGQIMSYLSKGMNRDEITLLALHLFNWGSLRYGENPSQQANLLDFLRSDEPNKLTTAGAPDGIDEQARLSYNNYLDADAALGLCAEIARAAEELWDRFSTGHSVRAGFQPAPSGFAPVTGEQFSRRKLPHIQNPESSYFVTFRLKQGQLSPSERDIVLSACKHWHGRKMTLHRVVVMPDHVHLLMTPHEVRPGEWVSLSELMHSIKRFAAQEINKLRGTEGALWQSESFDRVCRGEREFIAKWEYIEANPVTAGLVEHPKDYPWSWASDAGFQEQLREAEAEGDRLKTCRTSDRLETGPTTSISPTTSSSSTTFSSPTSSPLCCCVFIKHSNACGVGIHRDPLEAYRRAYLGDPNAAMGGVLACNFRVDAEFAAGVMSTFDRLGKPLRDAGATHTPGGFFVEVWLAPEFSDAAAAIIRGRAEVLEKARDQMGEPLSPARLAEVRAIFDHQPPKKWGENVRLLSVGDMNEPPDPNAMQYRSIAGGLLAQTPDTLALNESDWKIVTNRAPTDAELRDLRLAWLICKHTKSNAITLCKDGRLIGNGAGQMSRVMSCRIATWLARENGHADALAGSVAASDAFFPFKDGPQILIDAGVTALIQPGGSKRDDETVALCNERNVAMIFTSTRHFRH